MARDRGDDPNTPAARARRALTYPVARYAIAVTATAAAFFARIGLSPYLSAPYVLFYPAVMAVAVLAGFGPALVSTALSALLSVFWILPAERPFHDLPSRDAVGLVLFTGGGIFVSIVARIYRDTRRRLDEYERARMVKELDERVRASEQRLRAVMDTIPEPVFLKDRESRLLIANSATLRVIGKAADQVIGRSDREIYDDPEVGDALVATDRRVMEAGVPAVVEERVQTPAGYRVFLSTKAPFRDAAGRVIGLIGISRDITDRKSAEEALRRSEAILAQAGAMAHLGAWWIDIADPDDLDASPLRWSDAVYRIFGYAPGGVEVTNALFFQAVHPDDRAAVVAAVRAALAARRPYEIEHRIVRRDGAERVVLEHAEFDFDDAGRPLRLIGAVQDVTERKRAAEALRESERNLRDVDRRRSEFLGVLSHELRNPLAPIRNALYILDRVPPGDDRAIRAQDVVRRQVDHLTRLVDDLLDVTRISRGKIVLQRGRVDLRDLVLRTVEDYRHVLAEREIALDVRVPSDAAWVEADATRLSQVVGNLLHNSAKFTDRGGHVDVAMTREGERVAISVRDTGIGVAADMLGRMFEPFTQADDSLHREWGGLGLGLALVKGLVELHGGAVEARSGGVGRGTEIVVLLHLARGEDVAPPPPPAAPLHGRSATRVLVIEDNPDAAETLRQMLELWGHEVSVAHDGRQGVEQARAFRPDAILCDIGLPEMDGYEVARAIRADPDLASTVLVALTGYALPDDQRRALAAGFELHLAKPLSGPKIEEMLARAVATSSAGRT
ncbi:MAG TPA: PAS domain S-box protein [Anaeromyxobacter sp.]|nr:PAS domain S-box protein [Anaeromyxobacter sp.]